MSSNSHLFLRWIWLFFLLLLPVVFWALPAGYFDSGVSICPSKFFFGLDCYGCGTTRALLHFHHFEWRTAFMHNRGVPFYYSFILVIWGLYLLGALKNTGIITPSEWKHRWAKHIDDFIPNRP